jgi:hypothetical protein
MAVLISNLEVEVGASSFEIQGVKRLELLKVEMIKYRYRSHSRRKLKPAVGHCRLFRLGVFLVFNLSLILCCWFMLLAVMKAI